MDVKEYWMVRARKAEQELADSKNVRKSCLKSNVKFTEDVNK